MHTHKQFLPMLREREVADKFGDTTGATGGDIGVLSATAPTKAKELNTKEFGETRNGCTHLRV